MKAMPHFPECRSRVHSFAPALDPADDLAEVPLTISVSLVVQAMAGRLNADLLR